METQEEDDEEQEQEQEQEHDSSSSSSSRRRRRRSGNSSNNKKRSKTKRKRKAACTACHARCAAAMHNDNDNDNNKTKTKMKMKTKKSKREWPSLRFMAMLQFPRCHYSLKIGIRTAEKLAEKGYRRRRRTRGEGEGDEGVKVFVEGPAEGEVWPLNLSVKRRCFNRGWRHFVEANGLGHGDILLFTQICESHLAVRVFNSPAGHEKMFFPSPSPLRRLSAGVRFRFHYHDNSCSSSNNNNDTSAAKYDDDIVAFSSYPSTTTTTKPRRKMQLLTLTSQERKNPSPEFAVQLTESAVSKAYRISVPSKFAKQWMPQNATQLQLIFLESNKIWTVDFKLYERFKGFHWRDCALSNNLNLGDTCIFKLVNTEQYIFEVNVIKPIIPCSYTSTEDIKPGSNALMVHG